jgi:hypothetical protein
MFAIFLIHRSGGGLTVRGKTLKECRDNSSKFKSKDFIAATIPFAVYLDPNYSNIYECSIPKEILHSLGVELRLLAKSFDDE